MLSSFSKILVIILIIIPLISFGCKKEAKPVHINEHDAITELNTPQLSGVKYAYIKGIMQREENYFVSIVFIDYQLKNKTDERKRGKNLQFPDSLEVLELPDAYFVSPRAKSPEEILLNKSAAIKMQTYSHDSTGNYKFNESIPLTKLAILFTGKEYKRFQKIPFKLTLDKNGITSITEQYIP
ncbi:MAG: hypothetical protein Q8N83_09360 [Ignavibacteria bacterium]|nr:hypothetical protein [Ignavibacteria bacterium]